MKINKEETKKEFKPFTIEIETEEEMFELWSRLNTATNNVKDRPKSFPKYEYHEVNYEMWDMLDDYMKLKGYK